MWTAIQRARKGGMCVLFIAGVYGQVHWGSVCVCVRAPTHNLTRDEGDLQGVKTLDGGALCCQKRREGWLSQVFVYIFEEIYALLWIQQCEESGIEGKCVCMCV